MTALARGGDDEIREQMAAALPESLGPASLRRPSPPLIPDGRPEPRGYGDQLLDALLPVVRAAMDRRAAEAWEDAAAWLDQLASPTLRGDPFVLASTWASRALRSRAAALDGTP